MKKIILRVDFNVPLKANKILDTTKIDTIIPEIKALLKRNSVVILSHLGNGKKTDSLLPISTYLRTKLSKEENTRLKIEENTRWIKGETAKPNSPEYNRTIKHFALLGEEYIDDAFPVMHRAQASIVGLPKLFKKEGKVVKLGDYSKKEIKHLTKSLNLAKNKKNKTLLILSGVKTETKLPLIKKFLAIGAKVFVGGGNANQIIKDILNFKIGKSYYDHNFHFSKRDIAYLKNKIKTKQLLLPVDVILKNNKVELINKLKKDDYIADIGPTTLAILDQEINRANNIIMNGPLGIYQDGFDKGTISILKRLAKNEKDKNILIGGGDTIALIKKIKLKEDKNIHISLAGGAMLEFLTKDGKLPGIIALK